MKRNHWGIIATCICLVSFFVVPILVAEDAPEDITIKCELFKEYKKAPVQLTHKKHVEDYGIACKDCHHVYTDGKNTWEPGQEVKKCGACHNVVKPIAECSPAEKKLNLQKAFHDNCKGCHMALKREKKPTGPIKCTECHKE